LNIVAPFYYFPPFEKTKSSTILDSKRTLVKIHIAFLNFTSSNNLLSKFVKNLVMSFWFLTQSGYVLLTLTTLGLVQAAFLSIIGNSRREELTYKLISYSPVLHRVIGSFLTVYLVTWRDIPEWEAFDKYNEFSLTHGQQNQAMKRILISCVPDCILTALELLVAVNLSRFDNSRTVFEDPYQLTSAYNLLLNVMTLAIGSTNAMIRYKSLINLNYTQTCVAKHMDFMSEQLSSPKKHSASENKIGLRALSERTKMKKNSFKKTRAQVGEIIRLEGERQIFKERDGTQVRINNLHDLETHLCKIEQLILFFDRMAPMRVFLVVVVNFIYVLTATIICFYVPYELIRYDLVVITLTSRAIPIFYMFYRGHCLERSCKRLAKMMEKTFFEEASSCLIYKHIGTDSNQSLERSFRLLNRMSLKCDGLLSVNLQTLENWIIFYGSYLFIFFQYDHITRMENS